MWDVPSPMIVASLVPLHGVGPEVTLLEYLGRVLLHLVAFGGTAVVVLKVAEGARAVRSVLPREPGGEESDG